ncbi:hypothetical protein L7F22_001669 [Adiantum nelumboides]|nr:hypothetical protein [Adiantum nelumboides]
MGAQRGSQRGVRLLMARLPLKVKVGMGFVAAIAALLVFRAFELHELDYLFIAAEAVHTVGIVVLIYKLTKRKNCTGLSLKSQELTALFLAIRIYCSFVLEYDIHTILDTLTLITTCWVIYTIRFKLRGTYMKEMDNFSNFFVIIPCAILSFFIHPITRHWIQNRVLWAFCIYLETVSMLPQLRMMQSNKVVEPFTGKYVFALGIARYLSCAHWILQVVETCGRYLFRTGRGLWPGMILFSEFVQTSILADFCYYYIKSMVAGETVLRLPSGVV